MIKNFFKKLYQYDWIMYEDKPHLIIKHNPKLKYLQLQSIYDDRSKQVIYNDLKNFIKLTPPQYEIGDQVLYIGRALTGLPTYSTAYIIDIQDHPVNNYIIKNDLTMHLVCPYEIVRLDL